MEWGYITYECDSGILHFRIQPPANPHTDFADHFPNGMNMWRTNDVFISQEFPSDHYQLVSLYMVSSYNHFWR